MSITIRSVDPKTLIKVLTAARPLLDECMFLCNAISAARTAGSVGCHECLVVRDYIRDLLGDSHIVEDWLSAQGIVTDYYGMKEYRLRWVAHMIAQAEKDIT